MKTIPLTNDDERVLVDDGDYSRIKGFPWRALKDKRTTNKYAVITRKRTTIYMHREILGVMGRSIITDHINGKTLDNQRHNLRICNAGQNAQNCKKHSHYRGKATASKFKGVRRIHDPRRKAKWMAVITCKYKRINVGRFMSEKEAALAYNQKSLELFGPFAHLNEI